MKDDLVEWRMINGEWEKGQSVSEKDIVRTWKQQETAEEEADRGPGYWNEMLYTLVDYIMAERKARVYCRLCPICPAG